MQNPNQDDLVPCPYDSKHLVMYKRLAYHITKCRENYKGSEMKTCPYNALHIIPVHNYLTHLFTCQYRRSLDRSIALYNEGSENIFKHFSKDNMDDWEPDSCEKRFFSDNFLFASDELAALAECPPSQPQFRVQSIDYFRQIYGQDEKSTDKFEDYQKQAPKKLIGIGRGRRS